MMEMVRLGKTEITVPKNGFGALPVQRVSLEDGVKLLDSMNGVCGIFMTEDGQLHFSQGAEAFLEPASQDGA